MIVVDYKNLLPWPIHTKRVTLLQDPHARVRWIPRGRIRACAETSYRGSLNMCDRCTSPMGYTKVSNRLKSLMIPETSSHSHSRLVNLTVKMQGKIWSSIRAAVDRDPTGKGVSPTSSSVKAQHSRGVTSSSEGGGVVVLSAASTKVVA